MENGDDDDDNGDDNGESGVMQNEDVAFDNIRLVAPTGAPPSPVPLPAAVWLFGSALAGLGIAARRPG